MSALAEFPDIQFNSYIHRLKEIYEIMKILSVPILAVRSSRFLKRIKDFIIVLRNKKRIIQSELFDEDYYLHNNPDIKNSGISPIKHYILFGGFETRNPSNKFSSSFYLNQYSDVRKSKVNPLVHYILYGKKEGRMPKPYELMDPIIQANTDIVDVGQIRDAYCTFMFNNLSNDYDKWLYRNRLTNKMIELMLDSYKEFSFLPVFSIIIPVYNTKKTYLIQAIHSVLSQIYDKWELILIDDSSDMEQKSIMDFYAENPKIKYKRLIKNSGVSVATNEGIKLSKGDYLIFMDHDDIIERDALFQIARFLQDDKCDIIYTDDGTIDEKNKFSFPYFKPDWSPELAYSFCYIRHLKIYSIDIIRKTGFYDSDLDGSQDYDFFLRATRNANRIHHLPLLMYHWRNYDEQLSKNKRSKTSGMMAVQRHLERAGIDWVKVTMPDYATTENIGIYKLEPLVAFNDVVSIIIPVRNEHELLKRCLESIKKSTHKQYEIIIADDESDDPESIQYLQELTGNGVKILKINRENDIFNFSRLNNLAVEVATGDYLVFLNSDTEILSPDWMEQLLCYCKMPEVGAVGLKLLFPDKRIQHAGVIITLASIPAHHPFIGMNGNGYNNLARYARNYAAVTAACMMVKRKVFLSVKGFDEELFRISYNDVDLCLKILNEGNRIVYNPYAEIFHLEGASRRTSKTDVLYMNDTMNFLTKYKGFVDPYYNINQHQEFFFKENLNKNHRAYFFDKSNHEIKIVFFSHNLNYEGATIVMFKVAKFLHSRPNITVEVACPVNGPLAMSYVSEGIVVNKLQIESHMNTRDYNDLINKICEYLDNSKADLIFANTLDSFWAIEASYRMQIPSIWGIHESYDYVEYYKSHPVFSALSPYILGTIFKSNRNVFVCKSTMRLFEKYNVYGNMDYIYNGISLNTLDNDTHKNELRKKLNLPVKKSVTIIGTICERKGQIDFIKAAKEILKIRKDLLFLIIGSNINDAYYQNVLDAIDGNSDFIIIDNTKNIDDYFSITDVLTCCSYIESFPMVILEAMSFSLPIVTTPVFGISEQLVDGETALFYNPGDIDQLKYNIESCLDNPEFSKKMGQRANDVVKVLFREDDMLNKYLELFQNVVLEDNNINALSNCS